MNNAMMYITKGKNMNQINITEAIEFLKNQSDFTKKEIVKKLIGLIGLNDIEVAERLGMSKALFSYHLSKSADLSDGLYDRVITLLKNFHEGEQTIGSEINSFGKSKNK